jgi:hypothetical protein
MEGDRQMVRKTLVLAVMLALVVALAPAMAGSNWNFPKAGEYTINSHPSFLVTVGDSKEVVECNATLIVKAGDPYITKTGTRRVDLQVVNWKATGTSKLLGGPLNFRMLQGTKVADKSFVETYQVANVSNSSKDFPAKAQFAVPYEIDTPFGVVSNLVGVTRGTIKAFPPSNDVFMMEKGDIAKLMNALMPAPLSSMSASGTVQKAAVAIQPIACACPAPAERVPADGGLSGN